MPALVYKFQEQEYRFPLKDRTTIGCGRNSDLCLPSNSIALLHAVITRDSEGYQLEDAGSDTGIVMDGERVPFCLLRDGTVFSLGDVEFAFEADGAEAGAVEVAVAAQAATTPDRTNRTDGTDQPEQTSEGAEAPAPDPLSAPPEEVIARFDKARERVLGEIGKVIVGQKEVLNQMLVALFARGHCLLIGVPGLAKTLMVRTLGSVLDLDSRRIQFTPDLMPSDITGTDILEEDSVTGKRAFRFHRGPIFSNLLLADEINRTPPKTQAALLEAMQEQRVTISGTSYDLPNPFMVLATQNPIEQEGTYPLPEAQLDRFMFCIHLAYPSAQEEQQVILDTTRDAPTAVERALDTVQVLELQQLVRRVPVSQHVALYALNLVRATRPNCERSLDFVNRWVNWGAGPRAGQYLLLAAKTHVLLQGRFSVSCADVREYALPVLRHRIFPTFTAASESVTTDQIVKKIVEAVKEPNY
jgi:MoxR-like ATPase